MTRVWLIDDDQDVRAGVAGALSRDSEGLQLTGLFEHGRAALAAADAGGKWDVALVDLGLPDVPGESVIRQLRRQQPEGAAIAFTVRADDAAIFGALRAGAAGYLTKELSAGEIAAAIAAAARGAAPMSPGVSRRVVASFWPATASNNNAALTRREQEVLDMLCTGASYRQVGTLLDIAEGTVQTHVKNLYRKLGASSKAEAVRLAMELRLLQPLARSGGGA